MRTTSVMPQSVTPPEAPSFAPANVTIGGPTHIQFGAPQLQSTPAVKSNFDAAPASLGSTITKTKPSSFATKMQSTLTAPSVAENTDATFVVKKDVPVKVHAAFTEQDLIDLVDEFECELINYKNQNGQLDLSGLNEEQRKSNGQRIAECTNFTKALTQVF